jgi:hypothetical protein
VSQPFGFFAAQAEADAKALSAQLEANADAWERGVTDLAFNSIVEGSAITGAPGSPVQSGILKGDWQRRWTGRDEVEIVNSKVYAQGIEDQISPHGKTLVLRSEVGGFHSVKLTIAGIQALADKAAEVMGVSSRTVGAQRLGTVEGPEVMGGA